MFGPGAYRPDPTEGMTAIADLPPPEIVASSRTYTRQACPRCGHQAYRDKQYQRRLHDLGNLDVWCPRDLVVTYSQHYCTKCHKYFNLSLTVPRYTNGRACDLNGLQEIIHVSRLSFFTHSCTRSFFVSSLKERNYTYSMYLSTVKVGLDEIEIVFDSFQHPENRRRSPP